MANAPELTPDLGARPTELARRAQVTKQALTQLIRELSAGGDIELVAEERRASTLTRASRERGRERRALREGFLQPPLFATDGDSRLGTLYTVSYHVGEGRAEFRWPDLVWDQRFEAFEEGMRSVRSTEQPAT